MSNGKNYRIGTDQPAEHLDAGLRIGESLLDPLWVALSRLVS